jgi:hypothetical protein
MTRWLFAAAVGVLACSMADAQAPVGPAKARLVISDSKIDQVPPNYDDLRPGVLRPNLEQEILTYVQNTDLKARTLTVQLVVNGDPVGAKEVKIDPGKLVLVPWPKAAPAPGEKALPMAEATGPAELRLLDEEKKLVGEAIKLRIDRPVSYLGATASFRPANEDGSPNRLAVTVNAKNTFQGPRSYVELVLDPDLIPRYVPDQKKKGFYGGYVYGPGGASLRLIATDLQLRSGDRDNGVFSLRADGYNRAFLFLETFKADREDRRATEPLTRPCLRLKVARAADPRQPVRATIEADNFADPRNTKFVLEVGSPLERASKDLPQFNPFAEFKGERSEQLFYGSGGPQGGLLFRPAVNDWVAELNFKDLRGTIPLRLVARDAKNLPLLDSQKKPLKVLNTETGREVEEVLKQIDIDDTPPEQVAVAVLAAVDPGLPPLPKGRVYRGSKIRLRATGADPESGIREVIFFAGRPLPDGTIPPTAAFVRVDKPTKPEKGPVYWAGELDVPADVRGSFAVAVRFVNNAGLATNQELLPMLEVVDLPPGGAVKGSIAGIVREGSRTQPGLVVVLSDVTGKKVAETTSAADGSFLFEGLDPGTYKVSAVMTADSTRGETDVPLKAGEQFKGADIKLWR